LTQPSKSVLVAGGAGYIGSHTSKLLAQSGREPVVLDNMSTGHSWAAKWGPLYIGDIEDGGLVKEIVQKYGIKDVIHFAGKIVVGESYRDPGKYFRENVTKTIRLFDALVEAKVERIVFSSTAAVYGDPEIVPIRETESLKPVNPYGETKLFVERMLHWYGLAHGLRSVALRYFNACGADPDGELGEMHDPETHLIPLAFEAVQGKRVLDLFGTDYPTPDGTCIRDYIHVCDLARAHILSLDYMREGGESTAMNLGTGVGQSVREVLSTVGDVTGVDVPHKVQPRRGGDAPVLVADPSLARQVLGWTAEYRDLKRIVETAWAWHQRTPVAS
jgi:UDP-arabinose 4-epimerase